MANMIHLPEMKTADSAYTGILPSVTRPSSAFCTHGPGYEAAHHRWSQFRISWASCNFQWAEWEIGNTWLACETISVPHQHNYYEVSRGPAGSPILQYT